MGSSCGTDPEWYILVASTRVPLSEGAKSLARPFYNAGWLAETAGEQVSSL